MLLMAIVALVVALGSLVVSYAALYATSLKRARISVHHAEGPSSWHVFGWNGLYPTGQHSVVVAIYAHNSGANAGILEHIEARSDATLGGVLARPVTFYPTKTRPDDHPSNFRAQLPRGIDAGDIEELFFVGRVPLALGRVERLHPDPDADREREESFARNLHDATPLPVTITWRYARPPGFLKRQGPDKLNETLTLRLPLDELRNQIARYWESESQRPQQDEYSERAARLASIVRTGRPPA